jgi:hypothetical protein
MVDGAGTPEQVAQRVWAEIAPLIRVPAGVR